MQSSRSLTQPTTTTVSGSSNSHASTTLPETQLDPGFYATVYQAVGNEVLWRRAKTPNSSFDGFSLASAGAVSSTRLTVSPPTDVQAGIIQHSSVPFSNFTRSEVSSVFSLNRLAGIDATWTVIEDGGWSGFPLATELVEDQTLGTVATQSSIVFQTSYTFQEQFPITEIVSAARLSKATGWADGIVSYEYLQPVTITSLNTTGGNGFTTASTSDGSFTEKKEKTVTVFAQTENCLVTSMAALPLYFTVAGLAGVKHSNTTGAYFTAPVSMEVQFSTVLHERSVSTIFPGTYTFKSGTSSGVLTASGLSFSYEAGTTTSSFVLGVAGEPLATEVGVIRPIFAAGLGQNETVIRNIGPGVYRKNGSTTFSTSGGFNTEVFLSSYWLEPLSYLTPGDATGDLVWTAPRNSTALPSS